MRNPSLLLRSGLTVAAASVLSLFAANPAAAVSGISVSTTGSTVSVTTSTCTDLNGNWGAASLLNSRQENFSQGRQSSLSGTNSLQSAAWSNVGPGTYTVIVICSNGTTAGTQSVVVSGASPTRTTSTTASPSRGVMGGMGGGSRDYGTLTLVGGGVLVGAGALATGLYLRRKSKSYRL